MGCTKADFNKLQAKWYKKLKDSGFEDAEQDEDNLKVWSLKRFTVENNLTLCAAKEEYYRLAGHFLHEHLFESELAKQCWELHGNGDSNVKITAILRAKGVKISKKRVQVLVKGLVKQMLLKYNVSR